jgi:ribose transport system ATP-binding protein
MTEHGQRAGSPAGALYVDGVTVDYGATRALDDVQLKIEPGRVHALLGANGSGKSSLLKALAGVSAARIRLSIRSGETGKPIGRLSSDAARALGLRFVHQDVGLIAELSVLDNLYLGTPRPAMLGQVRWVASSNRAGLALQAVGLDVDPKTPVQALRLSQRVLVATARALMDLPADRGFVFLDEPTAGLDEVEATRLLTKFRELADGGHVGVVLVTHRLREVTRFADDVTVLRDGVVSLSSKSADLDQNALVAAMIGRLPVEVSPTRNADADVQDDGSAPVLELDDVHGEELRGLTLSVRAGEIVGLTGLEGSGKGELIDLLYCLRRPVSGAIRFNGRSLARRRPADLVRMGFGLVPADRVGSGGIAELCAEDNLLLPSMSDFTGVTGFARRRARATTDADLSRFQIVPPEPSRRFDGFSGGNQQKMIVGRWVRRPLKVLLLHEPTAGVDVAAREVLWNEIRDASARGIAVVVASSDVAEAAELCDRVAVLVDGRLAVVLSGDDRTTEQILTASIASTHDV